MSESLSGTLLSLDLLAQVVALGKDVIREVVDGVSRANTINIDHTLSQNWNNLLHEELAHVKLLGVFELLHVRTDRL